MVHGSRPTPSDGGGGEGAPGGDMRSGQHMVSRWEPSRMHPSSRGPCCSRVSRFRLSPSLPPHHHHHQRAHEANTPHFAASGWLVNTHRTRNGHSEMDVKRWGVSTHRKASSLLGGACFKSRSLDCTPVFGIWFRRPKAGWS